MTKRVWSRQRIVWIALFMFATRGAPAAEPEVVSVTKIWDQGKHNAFTDLVRSNGAWYCTFREAAAHVGGDGRLRVLRSADGNTWESVALVAERGVDLRDPKLSIMPDGRLMLTAGGSVYVGKTLLGRQPRVAFSTDGRRWTHPQPILEEGEWLWRVTWHGGKAYGASYNAAARKTEAAQAAANSGKTEPGPSDWKLKLVSSNDGVKYDRIGYLDVPGHPNETTLRFMPDGEMVALVRREGGNTFGWIGRSQPPYTEWTWKETSHRLGGPNFIRLPDGALWAAGRSYPGGATTVLARMTRQGNYDPALTLDSRGDTSYPGLVWHNGLLWMSYYSSHEGKSAIYLAQIRVPLVPENTGSRLEPMVDDYLIEHTSGPVAWIPQQPEPRDVALVADKPWEGNTSAYYTVMVDGGKVRVYYRGSHFDEQNKTEPHPQVTCYAESSDGQQFQKPELGLFEFNGSKANNIVWSGKGSHNFTPFRDKNPKCASDARYKAFIGIKDGLQPLRSADGIHWQPMADGAVITKGKFDSQNLAFWDPHIGKYREYHRASRGVRDIMTGTSDDFVHWTDPQWLDYPDAPSEHLYTNAVQSYPGASHILVGFPTRFLPDREQTEPILMVSRDGQTFRRYGDAVIPRIAPADRTGNRSNYMAWGIVQLPSRPDEWSMYAKEAYYSGPASRLRRFTYRPDGLVALTSNDSEGSQPGEVATRPLIFTGRHLALNYRTAPGGSIRVELRDEQDKPIAPFTAEAGLLRGDHLSQRVTWSDNSDLSQLAGKTIRIRFILERAELFSLKFE